MRRAAAVGVGAVCGLVHGWLLAGSFPPIGLWPLTLVSLAPLVWLAVRLSRGRGARWACLGVMLGTVPSWMYVHRFLIDVTLPGWPPLALFLGFWEACSVGLLVLCLRGRLAVPLAGLVPVLWVGMEFWRGELLLGGYPWYLIGQPTIDLWGPLNPAKAGGLWLVGLAAAVPCGVLGDWLLGASLRRSVATATVIAGAALIAGWFGSWGTTEGGGVLRAGLVQTNMAQSNKQHAPFEQRLADYRRWLVMTSELASRSPRPDVIAWPETMFMGDSLNASAIRAFRESGLHYRIDPGIEVPGQERGQIEAAWCADELRRVQRAAGVPLLIGALATEGLRWESTPEGRIKPRFDSRYNSVFLLREGVVDESRYDKMELTPFGEMVPVLWRWPAIQQWLVGLGAAGMAFDLSFGATPTVFTLPVHGGVSARIATPICFEAAFARQCRLLSYQGGRRRVDMLLNLSNDGWFGESAGGREGHLLMARWRCVELGVPMARAVNTGISCWIDSGGVVRQAGPEGAAGGRQSWVEGVLLVDIPLPGDGSGTLYGVIGDSVGWAAMVAAALACLAAAVRLKRGFVGK